MNKEREALITIGEKAALGYSISGDSVLAVIKSIAQEATGMKFVVSGFSRIKRMPIHKVKDLPQGTFSAEPFTVKSVKKRKNPWKKYACDKCGKHIYAHDNHKCKGKK